MPTNQPDNQPQLYRMRLSELPPSMRESLLANFASDLSKDQQQDFERRMNEDPYIMMAFPQNPTSASSNQMDMAQWPSGDPGNEELDNLFLNQTLIKQAELLESDFVRLGVVEHIDDAISIRKQALLNTPDAHEERPDRLGDLGLCYLTRFQGIGELSDIDKSIECLNLAVLLTPDSHEDKPRLLSNLASSNVLRFEHLGELADLTKGIECQREAILLTSDEDSAKPVRLQNLGSSYIHRFRRFGELADIDKAIECLDQAVLLTDDDYENRSSLVLNLGTSYGHRFKRQGELTSLDQAIKFHRQAVKLTPDVDANKPDLLQSLAGSCMSRFDRLVELADLEQAIEYLIQAMKLVPDDHTNRPMLLDILGHAYRRRFESLGGLDDIEKAVVYLDQALLLTPDGHAMRPGRLGALGVAYRSRFERLGAVTDIDKAIELQSQGLLLLSDSVGDRSDILSSLGTLYQLRYHRFGEISDVVKAIDSLSEAVLVTPDDHQTKSSLLSNLGNAYTYRFQRLDELSDINKAIECHRQAVLLAPGDLALHSNLGTSFSRRFECIGELSDVDEAIACFSQALLLTPDGHTSKLRVLNNLAIAYSRRFDRFGRSSDIESAHSLFQKATQLPTTNPIIQLTCAITWTRYSTLIGASPTQAYQRTMELVPHLVWLGMTIKQRYDHLMNIGDFATEAASCAISLQDYDQALEWLEAGRSAVWNQVMQLCTPVDDLTAAAPTLAERIENIGRELERESSRLAMQPEQEAQSHRYLEAEWHQLLEEVRQVPGFGDFLQPHKVDTLRQAAKNGPVIIINVHRNRCDALIVQLERTGVAHVPLVSFSPEKAADAQAQLRSLVGARGSRVGGFRRVSSAQKPEEKFKAMLSTLWWDVVKPVLDFLGYTRKLPVDELPHITWCTTGETSFLPFHAAGCYDGVQPNADDLVISSYTPTLSALLASGAPIPNAHSGVLAIGQAQTKDPGYVPNAVSELAALSEQAKGMRYLQLDGKNATVGAVLEAMDKYSCVHFACRTSHNEVDPAKSAFHLHDGDLTLSAISESSIKNKGLAFLSNCQTAAGDKKLAGEAVHLAAGMLIAGYPSVIATMWAIHDEDGPEIARNLYSDVLKDGGLNYEGISRALHKAVVTMREKVGENSFERWVPFIHIGS